VEDIEVKTVEQIESLNDEIQQEMMASFMLGEKIHRLIAKEAAEGRVNHRAAWNALVNMLGALTMSFDDPRAGAAQAAAVLVRLVDKNVTARARAKN